MEAAFGGGDGRLSESFAVASDRAPRRRKEGGPAVDAFARLALFAARAAWPPPQPTDGDDDPSPARTAPATAAEALAMLGARVAASARGGRVASWAAAVATIPLRADERTAATAALFSGGNARANEVARRNPAPPLPAAATEDGRHLAPLAPVARAPMWVDDVASLAALADDLRARRRAAAASPPRGGDESGSAPVARVALDCEVGHGASREDCSAEQLRVA